jgi:hypothetical protein
MAKKTLGAPHREVVWISSASQGRSELHMADNTFPDDADCPSSYSYPLAPVAQLDEPKRLRLAGHRHALVLNLLGFRLVLMRNSSPHAA